MSENLLDNPNFKPASIQAVQREDWEEKGTGVRPEDVGCTYDLITEPWQLTGRRGIHEYRLETIPQGEKRIFCQVATTDILLISPNVVLKSEQAPMQPFIWHVFHKSAQRLVVLFQFLEGLSVRVAVFRGIT